MADAPRRFPPPWRAETIPGGYVVRDANGQAIAHVYSRATLVEAMQAKVLTVDEARRRAPTRIDRVLPFACRRDVDRVHARHCSEAGKGRGGAAMIVCVEGEEFFPKVAACSRMISMNAPRAGST